MIIDVVTIILLFYTGKGIEGRVDRDDKAAEGYVGGYKGKDTYDKKH